MICPRCLEEVVELIQPVGELEDSCRPCVDQEEFPLLSDAEALAFVGLTPDDL